MKNSFHCSLSLLVLITLIFSDVAVADDSSEVRSLLSAAAGIPNAQLQKLATSPTAPKLSEEDNQPLSLLCLTLSFDSVHASRFELERAFRFTTPGGRHPKPSKIAEAMARTKLLGFYTMIHSQTVRKVTCEVKGDGATGIVEFAAANLFDARVLYRAARNRGKWRIEEFSLPEWKTRTVLQENGKWKATGPAAAAVDLSLPAVRHGWLAIPADRPQVVLTISGPRNGQGETGKTSPQIRIEGQTVALEELVETLRKTVATQESRDNTTCVLRCDRKVSVEFLMKASREVRRAGFKSIVLGAVAGDSVSCVEIPFPAFDRETPKEDTQLPDIRVKFTMDGAGRINVWLGGRNLGTADKAYDQLSKQLMKLTFRLPGELFVVFEFDEPVSVSELANAISASLGRMENGRLRKYIRNFEFSAKSADDR
jgi:biopolymer transport protein ExbD